MSIHAVLVLFGYLVFYFGVGYGYFAVSNYAYPGGLTYGQRLDAGERISVFEIASWPLLASVAAVDWVCRFIQRLIIPRFPAK